MRSAVVGQHLNPVSDIPTHLASAVGLLHVFLVAALSILGPVRSQHVGRDDRGVVLQEAKATAEPDTIVAQRIGQLDAHFVPDVSPAFLECLLDGNSLLAAEVAVGVERAAHQRHLLADVD